MIHITPDGIGFMEFTGDNWLELAKFLNFAEVRAYFDFTTYLHLCQSIQHSARPYMLRKHDWLAIRDYTIIRSKPHVGMLKPTIYHSWNDMEKDFVPCPTCICTIESDTELRRFCQYTRTGDIDTIQRLLPLYWIAKLNENGYIMIYNDKNLFSGYALQRGQWLVSIGMGPDFRLDTYQDEAFQMLYDQIGCVITQRNVQGDIQKEIMLEVPRFRTLRSTKLYKAIQCTNERFIEDVQKEYPLMAFHPTNVLGENRYCYAIVFDGLPIGAISTGQWLVFQPISSPAQPQFFIIDDNEYRRDYAELAWAPNYFDSSCRQMYYLNEVGKET